MTPNLILDVTSLEMSYGSRIMHMYCDAIESLNGRRIHLAALALRSLIELAGAASHYQQRLSLALAGGLANQEQLNDVIALLQAARIGSRFKWIALGTEESSQEAWDSLRKEYAKAKGHDDEPSPDVSQKSSAAFVAEIEKQVRRKWPSRNGVARLVYAMLSDICHPSWGGELLFVEGPIEDGWHKRAPEPSDDMVAYFIHHIAMPVFLNVAEVAMTALDGLVELQRSLIPQELSSPT